MRVSILLRGFLIVAAVLGVSVLVLIWYSARHTIGSGRVPVYLAALEEGTAQKPSPVVDVWINGKLEAKSVRGDRIPMLMLDTGHYAVKCTAPGYCPGVDTFDVTPTDSEGYSVCELRKLPPPTTP